MVFSDTTNKQGLIQDIDFLLFGSSDLLNTEYSLADRTRNLNIVWDEAVTELYKADPNFQWDDTSNTDFPIATVALVSGLDHYTLLDSALVIHRVRMMDVNGQMKTLEPVTKRELSDSDLVASGEPNKFYKLGGAVFPVPIPNYGYGSGVEIEFQRGGNHFVSGDTTKEPGFNPQFHNFLSIGASLRYAIANGLTKKIAQLRADKEVVRMKMVEHYQLRSPDARPKIKLLRKNLRNFGL